MSEPPHYCPHEKLNTVIAVGLMIVLILCVAIYGLNLNHKGVSDGQLIQLGGTIVGVFGGFIARGVTQTGTGRGGPSSQVDAPNASTVNVSQVGPEAAVAPAVEPEPPAH